MDPPFITKATYGKAHNHACELTNTDVILTYWPGNKCYHIFIRSFIKLFVIRDCPNLLSYYKNFRNVHEELERQLIYKKKFFMIHPLSNFRYYWETVMILIYTLTFLITPIMMVVSKSLFIKLTPLICFLHVMFCIDIIMTFLTGNIDNGHDHLTDMSFSSVAKYYLKGNFIFDLISVIPYSLICKKENCRLLLILTLIRFQTLKRYITHFTVRNNIYLRFFYYIQPLPYWFMVYYWLYWYCYNGYLPEFEKGMLIYNRHEFYVNLNNSKLRLLANVSLYSADSFIIMARYVTSTKTFNQAYHIERPDSFFFCIIVIVKTGLGIIFFLHIKIHVLMLLKYCDVKYIHQQLEEFLEHRRLPYYLIKRALQCYDFQYSTNNFQNRAFEKYLTSELISELFVYRHRDLIETVSVFKYLPRDILFKMISCVTSEYFLPGDTIIKYSAYGSNLYIIDSGTVAVYSKNEEEICHLDDGAYFGESALIAEYEFQTQTIIAIEITKLYKLSSVDFYNIIKDYPILFDRIYSEVKNRFEEKKTDPLVN